MARLTRPRPLQIGAISAHGDELVAVDELLPIAVVFSAAGDVQAVHAWELSPTERAGERVNNVLLTTEEILIISPAAGGVVRIDRRSGVSSTVAIDPPPWFIVAGGDTVWLGDPAYGGYYLNEPTPTPPHTVSCPVIWEEDVEVERDPAGQFPEWGPWPRLVKKKGPRPSDSIGRQAVLEVSSPGHLWRLRGDRAEPVDLGGVVGTAYGSTHGLLVTCRMPDDPMIRERSYGPQGGARHVARSESVLLVHDDGAFEVIAKVRSVGRFVPAGDGCALFAGFETEDKTLRLLDFDHRRFGDPIPFSSEANSYPVLIHGNRLVSFNYQNMTLSRTATDGSESRSIALAGERTWNVGISRTFISCGRADRSELFVFDTDSLTLREIPMIDTAPHAPLLVEHDADLTGYEQAQLELVRSTLTSESKPGESWPWKLDDVTFESFEITGEYPYTEIVGLFSIDYAPGRRFGRRWRLYNDLGDMSSPGDDVWLPLEEAVAPGHAGYGIEESDDGVIWI